MFYVHYKKNIYIKSTLAGTLTNNKLIKTYKTKDRYYIYAT